MQVIFDPKTHTYKDEKGNIYPSVTTVLSDLGISADYSEVKNIEYYANRGEAVHYAIELLLSGIDGEIYDDMLSTKLEELNIPKKDIEGYVESAKKIVHRCSPDAVEERFICGQWAGTADFVGEFDGKKIIIDWKTSKKSNVSYDLQLGAYCTALSVNNAAVALLDENGCEPTIVPMSDTAIDRWNKVVDIYFSGMSVEEKRKKAKEVAEEVVILDDKVAKDLAALRVKMKELDTQKKEIEKQSKPLEVSIFKRLSGRKGAYYGNGVEIVFVPVAGRTTVDTEGLIAFVEQKIPNIRDIVKEKFTKASEASYRIDVKLFEEKKTVAAPVVKKPAPAPRPEEEELIKVLTEGGYDVQTELRRIRTRYQRELSDMSALEIIGITSGYRKQKEEVNVPKAEENGILSQVRSRPFIAKIIEYAKGNVPEQKILEMAISRGVVENGKFMLSVAAENELYEEIKKMLGKESSAPKEPEPVKVEEQEQSPAQEQEPHPAIEPEEKVEQPKKRRGRPKKNADSENIEIPKVAKVDFTDSAQPIKSSRREPDLEAHIRETLKQRGMEDITEKFFVILERQYGKNVAFFDENEAAYVRKYVEVVKREEIDGWEV